MNDTHPSIKWIERQKKKLGNWDNTLKEAFDYTIPQLDQTNIDTPGSRVDDLVFDSTAQRAMFEQAAQTQADLVPPFEEWIDFDIPPSDEKLLSGKERGIVREALAEQRRVFHDAIDSSNFSARVTPAFLECAIATGAILVPEGDDDQPFYIQPVKIRNIIPGVGKDGRIVDIGRELKPYLDEIENTWPDAQWSPDTRKKIADGKEGMIELVETCLRNDRGTWDYKLVEKKDGHEVLARAYDVSPWVAFRSFAVADEIHGRGMALLNLGDIKTANKTTELALRRATLDVLGMWQYDDDGYINADNVIFEPLAMIPRASGSKGLENLVTPGNFNIAQINLAQLRQNIREGLLNVQLPSLVGPTKTATEVAANVDSAVTKQTPHMSSLYWEFVVPFVRRVRYILRKRGIIDDIIVNDRRMRIIPVSPLAKLAKRSQIANMDAAIARVVAFKPELADLVYDLERYVADTGADLGMKRWTRTPEERQEIKQAEAQRAALMEQVAAAGESQAA